jgi:hypothetical protein
MLILIRKLFISIIPSAYKVTSVLQYNFILSFFLSTQEHFRFIVWCYVDPMWVQALGWNAILQENTFDCIDKFTTRCVKRAWLCSSLSSKNPAFALGVVEQWIRVLGCCGMKTIQRLQLATNTFHAWVSTMLQYCMTLQQDSIPLQGLVKHKIVDPVALFVNIKCCLFRQYLLAYKRGRRQRNK